MLNLISIVVEVLFMCAVTSHVLIINKSISRLEYKFEELDNEVFNKSRVDNAENLMVETEQENAIEPEETVVKKRRTRKPKISKEIA